MTAQHPTFDDVLAAEARLEHLVVRTPATVHPGLDRLVGAATRIVVKHENLQHTGAFKVRGALNLMLQEPAGAVVGYSTGNHAQALAHAARHVGAHCTIVMPRDPNELKERAVRALDARVVLHGADLTQAAAHAAEIARDQGARLVSAADEPALVAGAATATLELLRDAPDVEVLVVPVGGGSGAAAASLVVQALAPHVELIGVQTSGARAAHDSWRSGDLLARPVTTRVEGLAVGRGFRLTQGILRHGLDDFLLVDDDAVVRAQHAYLTAAGTLAEGAGAAALAAVLEHPTRFAGRRVAVMCSGGNASDVEHRRALTCGGLVAPGIV
ncbi:threonine ammonia-lyase [Isoptericola jiangsuensis]|uniref:threonine ammonia-lyase n=1 Tax=Isoptericola jiangsuensis TaxID=548579 RepID=UPI003AAF29D3